MMNDNNSIDKLQRIIAGLEEENAVLKDRIADLEKQLELVGYEESSDEPVTINNYYLKKYLEIHDNVYQRRLQDLQEKKDNLQKEYDSITEQEEGFETLNNRNELSLNRINEIDSIISDYYYQLEKNKYDFEKEVVAVTKKETTVFRETMECLSEVLRAFNHAESNDEVIEVIDQLTQAIMINLYPVNVSLSNQKYNLVQKMNKLNEYEQTVKVETKNLTSEKKSLQNAIQTISLETVETMLDGIAVEITKVNKSAEELKELFTALKERNLKQIQDEIRHLKVLEYSSKDIAHSMDDLMAELESKLNIIDTETNRQLNKSMELSRLLSIKAQLEESKKEYDKCLSEYQHLESVYKKISSNITMMEEYIATTNKAIQAKAEFQDFVNRFDGAKSTVKIIQNEILNTEDKIKELKETRRLKALDPYAKAIIQNLTEEIKETENLLERYRNDLRNAEIEVNKMATSERNLKLINVLRDKQVIESKLPSLYNKQRELSNAVSDKYSELQKYEDSLREYDEVLNEIEAIEREINN